MFSLRVSRSLARVSSRCFAVPVVREVPVAVCDKMCSDAMPAEAALPTFPLLFPEGVASLFFFFLVAFFVLRPYSSTPPLRWEPWELLDA
jgi:hypothetical protein